MIPISESAIFENENLDFIVKGKSVEFQPSPQQLIHKKTNKIKIKKQTAEHLDLLSVDPKGHIALGFASASGSPGVLLRVRDQDDQDEEDQGRCPHDYELIIFQKNKVPIEIATQAVRLVAVN